MIKGQNIAESVKNYVLESSIRGYVESNNSEYACVFISHRSTDKEEAMAVAEFLRENDLNVYIDADDEGLQAATRNNDAEAIVQHIQKALSYSTHVLVLLSDKTRESWWVPYEIGYGKRGGKEIASLLLKKSEDDFPDYLKVETTLSNIRDLKHYAYEIKKEISSCMDIINEGLQIVQESNLENYVRCY